MPTSGRAAAVLHRSGLFPMRSCSASEMKGCFQIRELSEDSFVERFDLESKQVITKSKVTSVYRCRSARRIAEICVGVRHRGAQRGHVPVPTITKSRVRRMPRVAVLT